VTAPPVAGRRPPGPHGYPLVGVLPMARRSPLAYLCEAARRYGDVVSLPLGLHRTYLVSHPDLVRHILQDVHTYQKEPTAARVRALFGGSLTTIDGDRWQRERQLMLPAFHATRLTAMVPVMVRAAATMLDHWESHAGSGRPLDVVNEMTGLARGIIIRAIFGEVPADRLRAVSHAMHEALEQTHQRLWSALPVSERLPTPGNRRFREALRTIDAFVRESVEEGRRRIDPAPSILCALLEARDPQTGRGMAEVELRREVTALLFAGHATTACALAWTWVLLSIHPWAEERVQQEIRTVLAGRPPAAEDLPALAYTRMVIDEVLRLYPPTWLTARMPLSDVDLDGYRIPAGTILLLSPYVTHRLPAFWGDPERFDPERFTIERSAGRPAFAYFPFGRGPRSCIGTGLAVMEMMLIIAMVAQRYRLTLAPGSIVEPDPGLVLRPRPGVSMIPHRAGE